ncbi:MAG: hypothetical protein ACSNEK_01040 [Parachlamydiaceae bacterium]
MIAFILSFYVSLGICLCLPLGASQVEALRFLPGGKAEVYSSIILNKDVELEGNLNTFHCHQEALFNLALREDEDECGKSIKYPFQLSVILKAVNFHQFVNGQKVSEHLPFLEQAEVRSLYSFPLNFVLTQDSLELEENQKKIFGNYQFFSSDYFNAVVGDSIREIFLLAERSLQEGEHYQFFKKLGEVDLLLDYHIQEITREGVHVGIHGNLQRIKLGLEASDPLNPYSVKTVISGEIQGEVFWNRKNPLAFTSIQKGFLDYSFKLRACPATVHLEFSHYILSKIKSSHESLGSN